MKLFKRSEFVDEVTGLNLLMTDYFSEKKLVDKKFKLQETWIEKEKHFQWQLIFENSKGSAEAFVCDCYLNKIEYGEDEFEGLVVPNEVMFFTILIEKSNDVLTQKKEEVLNLYKDFVNSRI